MSNKIILLSFLFTTIVFAAAKAQQPDTLTVPAAEFKKLMTNDNLVDVRTPEEFNKEHLAGAINIDVKAESLG